MGDENRVRKTPIECADEVHRFETDARRCQCGVASRSKCLIRECEEGDIVRRTKDSTGLYTVIERIPCPYCLPLFEGHFSEVERSCVK